MSQFFDSALVQCLSASITLPAAFPFSFSAWIKPTTIGSDQMIACFTNAGTRYHYLILGGPVNPKLKILTSDTGLASSAADVVTGSWQHVVGVWAGSGSRSCYLNNVKATSTQDVNPGTPNLVSLGAQPAGTNVYHGLIAEACIFTEALSDAQVQRLYLGCSPKRIGGSGGLTLQTYARWHLAGGVLKDQVRGIVLADLASATTTNADHPRVYK
jgi:hypothetical protein